MITIIAGTNRPKSLSSQLADQYSAMLAHHNAASQILDLGELPIDFIFSALYHNTGKNEAFNEITAKLQLSEKFVFIVPEYNGSFPGVLKAFIDGMDYPNPLKDKKAALVGISSGVQGASLALSHLTDILNYLGMHVLAQKPRLAQIEENMTENRLKNKLYIQLIQEQVEALLRF
jgi:chromate reductase